MPPPAPPPLVAASEGKIDSSAIWQWNDRLALVVAGLTLFLLGIFAGRIFAPGNSSEIAVGSVAVVSQAYTPESFIPAQVEATADEVNPELVLDNDPPLPVPAPEVIAPVPPPAAPPAAPANPPVPASTVVTTPTAESPTTEPAVAESPKTFATPVAAPEQFSPVSSGSKVPTIKPLASTQVCEPAEKYKDRKLNTALTWAESIQEASHQAEDEEKLVFLIHVSGNFEMPGFT